MEKLLELDRQLIWHPYTQAKTAREPLLVEKAQGAYLILANGKRIYDGISSWWVNLHGHAHPHLTAAISAQAATLEQVIFADFTHEKAIALADRILKCLPPHFSKVFYSDNGSTAVEVAIKTAFQYWYNRGTPRQKIISLRHSYHGDTFGAMSVGERGLFNRPFDRQLFPVEFIAPPLRGNEALGRISWAEKSLEQLTELLERDYRRPPEQRELACLIVEPLVQGAGGMLMQDIAALDQMLALAREYGVLVIADEVMTGFGRTGKMFATDHLNRGQADMICLSKGLTGGTLPLAMTVCTEDIYQQFYSDDPHKAFFHGHSFTANPLGCAAALAALDLLEDSSCSMAIFQMEVHHQAFKKELEEKYAHQLSDVRLQGTILAIELKTKEESNYFNSIRQKAYSFFLERGLLIRPLGNVLYLIPPYCSTSKDLGQAYGAICEFLDEY